MQILCDRKYIFEIITIPILQINHETYKKTIKEIRLNTKILEISGVCYSFMLRVYACVFCSISMLFVSFKFKVHCGSALGLGASGLLYYCTPLVTVSDVIGGLAV